MSENIRSLAESDPEVAVAAARGEFWRMSSRNRLKAVIERAAESGIEKLPVPENVMMLRRMV